MCLNLNFLNQWHSFEMYSTMLLVNYMDVGPVPYPVTFDCIFFLYSGISHLKMLHQQSRTLD